MSRRRARGRRRKHAGARVYMGRLAAVTTSCKHDGESRLVLVLGLVNTRRVRVRVLLPAATDATPNIITRAGEDASVKSVWFCKTSRRGRRRSKARAAAASIQTARPARDAPLEPRPGKKRLERRLRPAAPAILPSPRGSLGAASAPRAVTWHPHQQQAQSPVRRAIIREATAHATTAPPTPLGTPMIGADSRRSRSSRPFRRQQRRLHRHVLEEDVYARRGAAWRRGTEKAATTAAAEREFVVHREAGEAARVSHAHGGKPQHEAPTARPKRGGRSSSSSRQASWACRSSSSTTRRSPPVKGTSAHRARGAQAAAVRRRPAAPRLAELEPSAASPGTHEASKVQPPSIRKPTAEVRR